MSATVTGPIASAKASDFLPSVEYFAAAKTAASDSAGSKRTEIPTGTADAPIASKRPAADAKVEEGKLAAALKSLQAYQDAAATALTRKWGAKAKTADVAAKAQQVLQKWGEVRNAMEQELRLAPESEVDGKAQELLARLLVAADKLNQTQTELLPDRRNDTQRLVHEALSEATRAAKAQVSRESLQTRATKSALFEFRQADNERRENGASTTVQARHAEAARALGVALYQEYVSILPTGSPDQLKVATAKLKDIHPALGGMIDEIEAGFVEQIALERAKETSVTQLQNELDDIAKSDPQSLTDVEQKLVESGDRTSAAFLKAAGVKIDNSGHNLSFAINGQSVTLNKMERQLASQPILLAWLKLGKIDIETTPLNLPHVTIDGKPISLDAEQQRLARDNQVSALAISLLQQAKFDPNVVNLIQAMPAMRLASTKAQMTELMAGDQPKRAEALNILAANLNAAVSSQERAQLWKEAGEPYFSQSSFEQQIDTLLADSEPSDSPGTRPLTDFRIRADKVGAWMQAKTKDVPPELASAVLGAVRAKYRTNWQQASRPDLSGILTTGVEFYKGLSQAVDIAGRLRETDQTKEIAAWVTDRSPTAPGSWLMPTLQSQQGFLRTLSSTVEGGRGERLSQAVGQELAPSEDAGWHIDFQQAVEYGVRAGREKLFRQIKHEEYLEFKRNQNQVVQSFFDDLLKAGKAEDLTSSQSAADDTRLRNRIGVAMRKPPTDAAAAERNDHTKAWFSDPRDRAEIDLVARWIVKAGGPDMKVAAIPFVYAATDDVRTGALFEVKGRDGKTTLIDGSIAAYEIGMNGGKPFDSDQKPVLRSEYASFSEFLDKNKLSEDGLLYLPRNFLESRGLTGSAASGPQTTTILSAGRDGHAEWGATAAGRWTSSKSIEYWGSVSVAVLAIGGGIGLAAFSGGSSLGLSGWGAAALSASYIGVGASTAWGLGSSGLELWDMYSHGQTLNPLRSPDAAGALIGFAGSASDIGSITAKAVAIKFAERAATARNIVALNQAIGGTSADIAPYLAQIGHATVRADAWNQVSKGLGVVSAGTGGYLMLDQASAMIEAIRNGETVSAHDAMLAGLGVAGIGVAVWTHRRGIATDHQRALNLAVAGTREAAICEHCTGLQYNPQNAGAAYRQHVTVAFDPNITPNPDGPREPKMTRTERWIDKVGEVSLKGKPRYNSQTYFDLRRSINNPMSDAMPSSFQPDRQTLLAAGTPGGLESFVADGHFHPQPYDAREGLTLKDLVRVRDKNGNPKTPIAGDHQLIVVCSIPEKCGRYYANPDPTEATLWSARDRDERFAKQFLELYQENPSRPDQAAKFVPALTGLDFSEGGQHPNDYLLDMSLKYPGAFPLIGEITSENKEAIGYKQKGRWAWELNNKKYGDLLDLTAGSGHVIILHNDWGLHSLTPALRPAAAKTAGEHVDDLIAVHGAQDRQNATIDRRNARVVFAHFGVAQWVRPDPTLREADVKIVRWNRATQQVDVLAEKTVSAPEHIHMAYEILEKNPGATLELSWDVVLHALTHPKILPGLVQLMFDYQDRIHVGTDSLKPVNRGQYNQALQSAWPLWMEIAKRPGGGDVLRKILVDNLRNLVDDARKDVLSWTRQQLLANHPEQAVAEINEMDAREAALDEQRKIHRSGANEMFDRWLARVRDRLAEDAGRSRNDSQPAQRVFQQHGPRRFVAQEVDAPDRNSVAREIPESAYDIGETILPPAATQLWKHGSPLGTGSSGGGNNDSPWRLNATAVATGVGIGGAGLAAVHGGNTLLGARNQAVDLPTWNAANTIAFLARAALGLGKTVYLEKLRLDWEKIFEEGQVTRKDLDRFVGRIFALAPHYGLGDEQLLRVGAAAEQFWVNYQYLRGVQVDHSLAPDDRFGWTAEQKHLVIMAEVGRFRGAVDREVGAQSSSINALDARTPAGLAYAVATLSTYLANDVVTLQRLAHGDILSPEGAFNLLFGLGNAALTGHTIAKLARGRAGLPPEGSRLMLSLQTGAFWSLAAGGVPWFVHDGSLFLHAGDMTSAGVHLASTAFDAAYTYYMTKVALNESKTLGTQLMPSPHQSARPYIGLAIALGVRELIALVALATGVDPRQSASAVSTNSDGARELPRRTNPLESMEQEEFRSRHTDLGPLPVPDLSSIQGREPLSIEPHVRVAESPSVPLGEMYLPLPGQPVVKPGALHLRTDPSDKAAIIGIVMRGTFVAPTNEKPRKDERGDEWIRVRTRVAAGEAQPLSQRPLVTMLGWVRKDYVAGFSDRGPVGPYSPGKEGVHPARIIGRRDSSTMSGVAKQTGDSIRAIEERNRSHIPNPDVLVPGAKVYLRVPDAGGGNPRHKKALSRAHS